MSYQTETFYESKFSNAVSFLSLLSRLPVVSDCPAGQTARVTSNLHSSSSTMAVSRVPSPPLPEVNTPVAENWCYTQVRTRHNPLNTQRHYSQHSLYKKRGQAKSFGRDSLDTVVAPRRPALHILERSLPHSRKNIAPQSLEPTDDNKQNERHLDDDDDGGRSVLRAAGWQFRTLAHIITYVDLAAARAYTTRVTATSTLLHLLRYLSHARAFSPSRCLSQRSSSVLLLVALRVRYVVFCISTRVAVLQPSLPPRSPPPLSTFALKHVSFHIILLNGRRRSVVDLLHPHKSHRTAGCAVCQPHTGRLRCSLSSSCFFIS